jgi:uncharacterized protein (TIGR02246 family)
MKILLVAAAAIAPLSAAADPTTCSKGADIRVIEIIAPGEVGAACDLRYTREAGLNISVPFHANSDLSFCEQKAREVIAGLAASGFSCAAGAVSFDSRPATPKAPFETITQQEADAAVAAMKEIPQQSATPQPAQTAALEQPAPTVAHAGPVHLATDARTPTTRAAKPTGAGAGRLRAPSAPVLASTGAQDAPSVAPGRPAEDIIKGVLAAQVAAWNENDLDGFLAAYWQSPSTRFVAGGELVEGYDAVAQSYRANYGAGGDLGRLALTDLSVTMITDDVATVVGRFNLEDAKGVETGGYTLVMRKVDGRWRIAHDHTSPDQTAPAQRP